jgi:hypothetical protein
MIIDKRVGIMFFSVFGLICSPLLIIFGIDKRKIYDNPFRFGDLFKNIPLSRQSGIQLIIEGVLGFICSFGLVYMFWKDLASLWIRR